MFSRTATRGRNVSTVSSWKLDASTTQNPPAPAAGVPTASASGSPRLPPTKVGRPVARSMSPTSVVVVDLPFVPVMATIGAVTKRLASSSSPVMRDAGRARRRQLGDLGNAGGQHDQVRARERLAPVAAQLTRDRSRQRSRRGGQLAGAAACRSR